MSTATSTRIAAEALTDVLESWGIDKIFICPGSTEAAFLDTVSARNTMEVYLATHESVSVAMADGYSRATGQPSAVYLHANVGLTNGLSHLSAAKLARSPIVVLNGLKDSQLQAREGFTTAAHMRDFVRQYVKWDWQSLSANAVPEDANRALHRAVLEPSGPTWLGLSQDLMEATSDTSATAEGYRWSSATRPDRRHVQQAADLLHNARRPLLVAGSEVARHGAGRTLEQLAERLNAPLMLEDRRGLERISVSTGHPNFAGLYEISNELVQEADVIFFAGARCFLQFEPPSQNQVPATATLIHSHIDPAEIGKLHGVHVPLIGHEQAVLDDILEALEEAGPKTPLRPAEPRRPPLSVPARTAPAAALSAQEVVDVIAESLDAHTTVVSDATTAASLLLRTLPVTSDKQFATTASGSLGWGMGAALGMQLADPERNVLAVVGDGVFQFGIQALWTAVHYKLPVTYVVLNNRSFAANGAAILRYRRAAGVEREGPLPGVDISGPNIAEVARGFGARGIRVDDVDSLRRELTIRTRDNGPTLIEVMTDPTDLGPSPL